MAMALSDLVEYSLCYREDKKEHSRLLELVLRARSLVFGKRGHPKEEEVLLAPLTNCSDADRGTAVSLDLGNDSPGRSVWSSVEVDGGSLSQVKEGISLLRKFNWKHENEEEEEEEREEGDDDDDGNKRSNKLANSSQHLPQSRSRSDDTDGGSPSETRIHRLEKSTDILKSALKSMLPSRFKPRRTHFNSAVVNLAQVPQLNSVPLRYAERIRDGDDDDGKDGDDDDDDDDGKDGDDDDDDDGDDDDDDDDGKDGDESVRLLSGGSWATDWV